MLRLSELSRFQAAIFDMDGTLLDSESHYCDAYRHAMDSFGGSLTPEEYFRRYAGKTDDAIDRLLHAELERRVDLPTIRKTWHDEYHRLRTTRGVPLRPGAGDLLELLGAAGLPLAVASSAGMGDIECNLDLAGIGAHFTALSSGEEVADPKPAPDVYLLAAERLGVDPRCCLAFEDTNAGARAAIAAQMHTTMVPHNCEPDEFVRAHARRIANSLSEIVAELR